MVPPPAVLSTMPEPPLAEELLAKDVISTMPTPTYVCDSTDRGYKPKPKKGKPIDRSPVLRQHLEASRDKIIVTGPDFIGVTTLLRNLEKKGYAVDVCTKPPPAERATFSMEFFEKLVNRWARLATLPGVLLVEESPWTYLAKHAIYLEAPTRAACNAALAPLVLPTLTISLHSSGRAVGRRHPIHHHEPDVFAQPALKQMVQLQLLPHACYHVDATVAPVPLSERVLSLLKSKVFKVLEANVDGLDHI